MSLEHTLLNRLEARSIQLAQMKQEIHGLKLLVNEKIAINEQLAEQITTARLEREQMQYQISELRTECDRIREINKSLVPKSALKQAVQEAAELRSEVAKLRAEVPLESTREGLKNATAKIAELKNDVRRCYELADEIGRGEGESIVDLITRQAERITGLIAKLQEVTTDRDRVLNELAAIVAEANKTGRCGGDPVALLKQGQVDRDTAESLDRQLGAALALSNERAQEIRKLIDGHAEDMKAQAELLSKYESLLTKITDLGSYAMTLGRKEGEPLEMFMERQALRLAALESEAGKIGYVAKGEHEEAVTAARENGIHKGESLSGFIWRQCEGLRKSQAENAPLNKLFVVLCKQRGNLNEEIIYRAVDEASNAIKKLTA